VAGKKNGKLGKNYSMVTAGIKRANVKTRPNYLEEVRESGRGKLNRLQIQGGSRPLPKSLAKKKI